MTYIEAIRDKITDEEGQFERRRIGAIVLAILLLILLAGFAGFYNPAPTPEPAPPAEMPVKNVDTGDGYDSVQSAIDESNAGDTILLREGKHIAKREISVYQNELTIKGEDGAVVTWNGGREPHTASPTVFSLGAEGVTFENLVIDGKSQNTADDYYEVNSNQTDFGINTWGEEHTSNITLRDVTFKNTRNAGADMWRVDGLTLENVSGKIAIPKSKNVDAPNCNGILNLNKDGIYAYVC